MTNENRSTEAVITNETGTAAAGDSGEGKSVNKNAGRVLSADNEAALRSIFDTFKTLIDKMTGAAPPVVSDDVIETSGMPPAVTLPPGAERPNKENRQKDTMTDATTEAIVSELTQKVADSGIAMEKATAALSQKEEAITALTNELATTKADLKKISEAHALMETELAGFKQAQADAEFEKFLTTIKPGAYANAEDKAALRVLFDSDPRALCMKVADMVQVEAETKKEGMAHKQAEASAAASKRIGKWNPHTNKWEEVA